MIQIPAKSDGFLIRHPARQTMPFVLNSPHSGAEYPEAFVKKAALELAVLRRSEDYCIDDLFAAAPALGAPIMSARFPRCFLDLNREPYELDPEMFDEALPPYINAASQRVMSGLGTIAKICAEGHEIYAEPLSWQDGFQRIQDFYIPYHLALRELLDNTSKTFSVAILIDCHSMPSQKQRADIVIGDRHGRAASPLLSSFVHQAFAAHGYRVARNDPYAGGFITQHYGQPDRNIHALQIEINRALYMDEEQLILSEGWTKLREHINYILEQFKKFDFLTIKEGS